MAYGIDQEIQRKVDAYRANPQQLAQRYQQNQQLVDLLALQKLKTEKEQAANDIRAKMQQSPQTIAQQREQEVQQLTKNELAQQTQGIMQNRQRQQQKNLQRVAQGGLGSIAPPKQMASGGVVAFQGGGGVTEERVLAVLREQGLPDTPENRAGVRESLERRAEPSPEVAPEAPTEEKPRSPFRELGPGGGGLDAFLKARREQREGMASPEPSKAGTFAPLGLGALASAATPSATPAPAPTAPSGPPKGIAGIEGLGDTTPVPGTDLSGLSPAITGEAAAPVPARPGRADLETVLRPEQEDMYKGLEGIQGISAEDLPTSLPPEMMQDYDELFGATREMASQDGLSQYDALSQRTEQTLDRENIQRAYDRLARKSEESGLTPFERDRLQLMASIAGGFGTPRGAANMYREQVRQLNAEQAQLNRTLGIEEAAIDTNKAINTAMANAGLEGFKQASADRRTGLQGMVGLFDARLRAVSSLRSDELSRLRANLEFQLGKEQAKIDAQVRQNEALMNNRAEVVKAVKELQGDISDGVSLLTDNPLVQAFVDNVVSARNEKAISKSVEQFEAQVAAVKSATTIAMSLDENIAQQVMTLRSLLGVLAEMGGDEFVSARPANP